MTEATAKEVEETMKHTNLTPSAAAHQAKTAKKSAPKTKAKKAAVPAAKKAKSAPKAAKERASAAKTSPKTGEKAAAQPREMSKKDTILGLMGQKEGATMAELGQATGWLNHSIRGFVAGHLRKKLGLKIESTKNKAGERTYKIVK